MADANFSSVSLLLHGNGSNGSTTFTDSSNAARTVSVSGATVISTAQSKFGGASMYSNGTSDYLTVPFAAELSPPASGDFTAEMWVYLDNGEEGEVALISTYHSGGNSGFELLVNSGTLFALGRTGGSEFAIAEATTPIVDGVWTHVAVVCSGTTWQVYVGGTPGVSGSSSGQYTPATTQALRIFGSAVGSKWVTGYIDDLRITSGVARYSGSFTPPTAEFEHGAANTGTAALSAPMQTLSAAGTGPANRANLQCPTPTLAALGTVLGGIGVVQVMSPSPILYAVGHDATGDNGFQGSSPKQVLQAFGGATAGLTAPSGGLAFTGKVIVVGNAAVTSPMGYVVAEGKASEQARAALVVPMQRLVGYSGAVVSVTPIGKSELHASGTTGGAAVATLTAPLFDLVASGVVGNHGQAELIAPSPAMAQTAQAWLMAPSARLVAVGHAVVAVSYEAYSLNLKHQDADSPDELTHYTNYPFDRIVRYKNSYYGMNATGLYLLEGTTDFAEPAPTLVPWAFKTAMTDFELPNLKTVNWAYFGGRMGPAATISIHYGDTGEQNYAYTTPRGASAQNYRQPFGRGIKSRYYAFEAEGAGVLSLDSILFDVAKMARKV